MKKKTKSKSFYKKISIRHYVLVGILLLAGIFYFTPVRGIVAQKLVDKGNSYFNSGGVYDLEKAMKWYKSAVFVDHGLAAAHYQLARVYFVQNKLQEAKSEIDKAIAVNNNSNRAYYIKGLIDGYSENYQEAINDFNKFIEMFPKEWAGYNDLAWAYYKNKNYENAKTTLEKGLEVKPDNPWLLNGLGAAYHALGENDKAKDILDKAGQLAEKLTANEWKMAYPGNDPSSADWDLADFKTDIKVNQGLAYNKSPEEAIMTPACSASCQYACLGGCSMYMYCQDPDHGYNAHGDANYYWQDIGFSDTCCPPCSDSSWWPDTSERCSGEYFIQTSNCGNTRGAWGTAACPIPGSCAPPVDQWLCSLAWPNPGCGNGVAPVNFGFNGTNWNWDCPGINGGPPAIGCNVNKIADVQGQCGGSNGGVYCAKSQITSHCNTTFGDSDPTYNNTDKKWYWICNGQCSGGSSPQCSASMGSLFDAKVGSANGSNFCNGWPADDQLCETSSSIIKGSDPGLYGDYTWTCKGGMCGGIDVDGSAKGQGACGWIETN